MDRNGQMVSSEVTGMVQANSRLSGIPDLTMTFIDPDVIDDCSFHPCVRYNRFERDRVVRRVLVAITALATRPSLSDRTSPHSYAVR